MVNKFFLFWMSKILNYQNDLFSDENIFYQKASPFPKIPPIAYSDVYDENFKKFNHMKLRFEASFYTESILFKT